jgi:nucleoside-diphosphate kinase
MLLEKDNARNSKSEQLLEDRMAEQTGKLTFGIIKPDAVRDGKTGSILQRVTDGGFKPRAMKLIHLTKAEAEGFYAVHRERPFFGELTAFMSSGPCVVLALEKEGAVLAWRELMGATDPAKADEGTLRKEFGGSLGENAVHGSDSEENAAIEIAYFFSQLEMV